MKVDNSYKLIALAGNQHCYQYIMAVICFLFWLPISVSISSTITTLLVSLYISLQGSLYVAPSAYTTPTVLKVTLLQ